MPVYKEWIKKRKFRFYFNITRKRELKKKKTHPFQATEEKIRTIQYLNLKLFNLNFTKGGVMSMPWEADSGRELSGLNRDFWPFDT